MTGQAIRLEHLDKPGVVALEEAENRVHPVL